MSRVATVLVPFRISLLCESSLFAFFFLSVATLLRTPHVRITPAFPQAGSYYENAEQQMQQQQQMMMMQQQAEDFFREEDQVQQAIRLSRGVFDAGGGSVAAAGRRGAEAADYDGSADPDLQEALRRSVADTGKMATRFAVGGGEREVVAGGSGSTVTSASGAEGNNNGVGTGSEHSPVCL